MSARRALSAPEMSRTALVERSVGVARGAPRKALASCLFIWVLHAFGGRLGALY